MSGYDPPQSVPPRPMRAIPQPASGRALLGWAVDASNTFGIDLVEEIKVWARGRKLPRDIVKWDIEPVTDCMAFLSKFLDERGLLQIPPEARAQMPPPRPLDDPLGEVPGALTIHARDPHRAIKVQIKDIAKGVFQAAFQEQPTEEKVMAFIRVRCKEHGIVVPESIRNLSSRENLVSILLALEEDEADMRRVS
jgi:hypothetical protein